MEIKTRRKTEAGKETLKHFGVLMPSAQKADPSFAVCRGLTPASS